MTPPDQRQVRGERHGMHVLTEADVKDIRRRYVPGTNPRDRGNVSSLAAEYGVNTTTVWRAARGRTWKHLKEAPDDAD